MQYSPDDTAMPDDDRERLRLDQEAWRREQDEDIRHAGLAVQAALRWPGVQDGIDRLRRLHIQYAGLSQAIDLARVEYAHAYNSTRDMNPIARRLLGELIRLRSMQEGLEGPMRRAIDDLHTTTRGFLNVWPRDLRQYHRATSQIG
jgi:hypothetical protein